MRCNAVRCGAMRCGAMRCGAARCGDRSAQIWIRLEKIFTDLVARKWPRKLPTTVSHIVWSVITLKFCKCAGANLKEKLKETCAQRASPLNASSSPIEIQMHTVPDHKTKQTWEPPLERQRSKPPSLSHSPCMPELPSCTQRHQLFRAHVSPRTPPAETLKPKVATSCGHKVATTLAFRARHIQKVWPLCGHNLWPCLFSANGILATQLWPLLATRCGHILATRCGHTLATGLQVANGADILQDNWERRRAAKWWRCQRKASAI